MYLCHDKNLKRTGKYEKLCNVWNKKFIYGRISLQYKRKQLEEIDGNLLYILENTDSGIWEWNLDTDKISYPKSLGKLFGYKENKILNNFQEWYEKTHPQDKEYILKEIEKHMSGFNPFFCIEQRQLCENGIYKWLLIKGKIAEWDANGNPLKMIGIISDITDKKKKEEYIKKLEAKLQTLEKQESLKRIEAAIAHNLNNILAIILGNAELVLEFISQKPEGKFIKKIIDATNRATVLSEKMLICSGKMIFDIQNLDLLNLMREMAPIIKASLAENISLELNLPDKLPLVKADMRYVKQMIKNLILNASEAIGGKNGKITMMAETVYCNKAYLKDNNFSIKEGIYVCIKITDNGCGIDKKIIQKIFDPFFTTKFPGRGLGLALVSSVLEAFNGAVKVYSNPGESTVFTVFLPSIFEANKKNILLVDDENGVHLIAKTFFKKLGFNILTAVNGEEALKIYNDNKNQISCILLDMLMPVMDGLETIKKLNENNDFDVPVIVLSGLGEDEILKIFAGQKVACFMQKPCSFKIIFKKIMELIA